MFPGSGLIFMPHNIAILHRWRNVFLVLSCLLVPAASALYLIYCMRYGISHHVCDYYSDDPVLAWGDSAWYERSIFNYKCADGEPLYSVADKNSWYILSSLTTCSFVALTFFQIKVMNHIADLRDRGNQ